MEDSDHQSVAVISSSDDLLTEILIRLPVTSILRFKSVCKHWQLLLSHKHFTHRYDNLLKSPGLFGRTHLTLPYQTPFKPIYVPFDVENPNTPPFRTLDFYLNRSNVRMVQSCNGLLLCCTEHNGAIEYYVFNPTTKQLAIIPLPSVPEGQIASYKTICSMALAFHQTDCVHYKVVCIRALESRDFLQIQVYSSDTRSWKICIESFSEYQPDFRYPVYWNGAVHWVAHFQDRSFLCFKLDVEQLLMLPVPERLLFDERLLYIGESRGHLHLISHINREQVIFNVNVYEMLWDYSGWFVKYRLRLDALLDDFPDMVFQSLGSDDFGNSIFSFLCVFQVVDMVRGKEEEESFLVLVTPLKIIRYNVHDKSFKELYRYKEYSYEFTRVYRYIETLSSF